MAVEKLFFDILIALNHRHYDKARKLAKKTHRRHEVIGCEKIKSIIFSDIAFVYDEASHYYRIVVHDDNLNLFNTIPELLVDKRTGDINKCHLHHGKCKKKNIVVLLDYAAGRQAAVRAAEVFHLKLKIVDVNASNIVKITEHLIKKGYQYFVGPSYSSNVELLRNIIESKKAYFISPLSTFSNVIKPSNLLRLAINNQLTAEVVAVDAGSVPMLILTEDDPNAIDMANKLAAQLPGSAIYIVRNYLADTQAAIAMYPTLKTVFFSFTTFGQDYFNAIGSSTFPAGYSFWSNDSLILSPVVWTNAITSILPSYPPTDLQNDYFPLISTLDYLYVDAIYYFHQFILNGYRPLGSVTGVEEFDHEGNRIWKMFNQTIVSNGVTRIKGIIEQR